MRVGLIGYGLDRPLTGIGRYTLELARALVSAEKPPELTLMAAGGAGQLANDERIACVPMPGCRLLPGLLTAGNAVVLERARRLRLDVVHDPTGVAPLLLGTGRTRAVVTIHDVIPLSFPGHSSALDQLVYRFWLPRILSRGDQMILTPSQHSRQDIGQFLGVLDDRIRVIPYGVSAQFRELPGETVAARLQQRFGLTTPYILCVGALTERKNLGRVVLAFSDIAEAFPELRLVLVGPRVGRDTRLQDVIRDAPCSARILVTGPVLDSDLVTLYNGARVFLFPSLYEGFGLPVLEAMACGTPVIAGNGSSLPEVVGTAGITVNAGDVAAIAVAVRRVVSDGELAATMRIEGLAHAARFSWRETALQTIAAYEAVLSGSAR